MSKRSAGTASESKQHIEALRDSIGQLIAFGFTIYHHAKTIAENPAFKDDPTSDDYKSASASVIDTVVEVVPEDMADAFQDAINRDKSDHALEQVVPNVPKDWTAMLCKVRTDLWHWWRVWDASSASLDALPDGLSATLDALSDSRFGTADAAPPGHWLLRLRRLLKEIQTPLVWAKPNDAASEQIDLPRFVSNCRSQWIDDEWLGKLFRLSDFDRDLQASQDRPPSRRGKKKKPWYFETTPPDGSTFERKRGISGSLSQLAVWVGTSVKTLKKRNGEAWWIQSEHYRKYWIYFLSQEAYAEANQRRLAAERETEAETARNGTKREQ